MRGMNWPAGGSLWSGMRVTSAASGLSPAARLAAVTRMNWPFCTTTFQSPGGASRVKVPSGPLKVYGVPQARSTHSEQ